MKKIIIQLVVVSSIIIFSTSCKSKVDKISECLKKSANTFMIKGHQPTDQELTSLCSEFDGSLKGSDIDEKRKALEVLDTVKKHIEDKRLFTDVEQVSLPPLPCGLDFVKELIAVQEDKITQQGGRNAMNYYLKGRTLSCSIVVDMIVSDFMSEKPILYDGMIRVTGFIYDKGEILEQQVELLMPVAEAPNIKREIFYSDVKKGSEYPFQSTYRQIIKFTGNFYESPETAIGGIVFMFKPDKFEYIKPNPKTEIASYKGQPKFAFDENNSSASNEHETKAETKNTTEETPKAKSTEVENTTKTDNAIGLWTGDFGKDKLQIIIESIDANGVVKGYDEVKGNKRTLTGSRNENTFTLNEPGDDKWDGIFTFKYDPNAKTIAGEWKANNGKASKNFTLTK